MMIISMKFPVNEGVKEVVMSINECVLIYIDALQQFKSRKLTQDGKEFIFPFHKQHVSDDLDQNRRSPDEEEEIWIKI